MTSKYVNKYGIISIADTVVAQIASEAAMSSYGIVGLAYRNAGDGLLMLLKPEYMSKGVKIKVDGSNVFVDLDVILEYGVKIKVVTENIIESVKYNIENKTGLNVVSVNVYVQGIRN